jgi:hypothetical protein
VVLGDEFWYFPRFPVRNRDITVLLSFLFSPGLPSDCCVLGTPVVSPARFYHVVLHHILPFHTVSETMAYYYSICDTLISS